MRAKNGERPEKLFTRLSEESRQNLEAAAAEFSTSIGDVVNELLADLNAISAVLRGDFGGRNVERSIEAAAKIERAVKPRGQRPIGAMVAGAKRHAAKRRAGGGR